MRTNAFVNALLFTPICFLLCSCADNRIAEIDNLIWRDDFFNIEATSEQLQNQIKYNWNDFDNRPDNFFSSITVFGVRYDCRLSLSNNAFFISIFTEGKNEYYNDYGDGYQFMMGSHDKLEKYKNEEYTYKLHIYLSETSSYIEYCKDNDIDYPLTFDLYGYENK